MSKSWPKVRLGDVLRLDLNRVPVDASTTYPMVGVLSFGRGLFDREPIENGGTSYRYFNRLKADHVVMSQLFGWEGALALSSDEFAGKYLSPQFPTFLCDPLKLERGFLGWLMRRPALWEELGTRASGMGDRRRTLNPEALLACAIPLPPLAEQRRIVARIDELATHKDQVEHLRGQIEVECNALLTSVLMKLVATAPCRKMEQVAPVVRRPVDVVMDTEYPELGIRSFGKGTFHKPALDFLSVGSKRIFRIEPGDLVFSNVFAWEGGIAVAQPEDSGRLGSHRFITCLPDPAQATAEFLCFYFLMPEGLEKIRKASPGGAGRNRTLGIEKLAKIEVSIPAIEDQRQFGVLLAEVNALKRGQAESAAKLDALLPSILGYAFAGAL